MGTITNFI